MYKRLLFIGLCLCLLAAVATSVDAKCRVIAGIPFGCTDLCPQAEGNAGNTEKFPVNVCSAMIVTKGEAPPYGICWNPAWNAYNTSSDIFWDPDVAGVVQVTSADITDQKGNFEISFDPDLGQCFSWPGYLWPKLAESACPNSGWHYSRWVPLDYEALNFEAECDDSNNTLETYGDCYCKQGVNPDTGNEEGFWCPGRITEMYFYTAPYQYFENKDLVDPGRSVCYKCELNYTDPERQCGDVDNPMVCNETDMNDCIDNGLVSACDTAAGAN